MTIPSGEPLRLSSAERQVLTEAAAAVRDLPVIALRSGGSLAERDPESGTAAAELDDSVDPRADRGGGH